ncbi:amidohydrolase [Silanimonas sp.]|uniref:amidohydrolase n=1 Tax=Silanimonas sp. TaxID=1929290 RepID=UPI0022BAE0E6|nr:amidohydrolase [Silanimonas sp.]MCZ8061835.1 amidohydrolase [Silanimonas sp.]
MPAPACRAALSLALIAAAIATARPVQADPSLDAAIAAIEPKVVAWRRDIHQHPELGNREFRTSALVAEHLKGLGFDVKTGVAHTGVVGTLVGGKPGPVIALRADMDALPVTERVDLPYASKVRSTYNGQDVGVMHACGHDAHVAILMGVAEVLAARRDSIPGTIKFFFQPAEEGPPAGEEGGAELMVREGVMQNPKVEAVFGLHVNSVLPVGHVAYRPGGTMASAESFRIVIKGKQAHGAYPWSSVDPIVTATQVVMGLQTIVSRNVELTEGAAVVSVGRITGGVRANIIPEQVELEGTLRALNDDTRALLRERVRAVATQIAGAMGATAEVTVPDGVAYPVTFNDPELTARMLPSLQRAAGAENVVLRPAVTGAEDFSFFAQEAPGLFVFLGGRDPAMPAAQAPGHHTPEFQIDDRGLDLGVRVMAGLALDYLGGDAVAAP